MYLILGVMMLFSELGFGEEVRHYNNHEMTLELTKSEAFVDEVTIDRIDLKLSYSDDLEYCEINFKDTLYPCSIRVRELTY